jgi:phosphoesterase RecJ-like protein
MDSLGSSIGAYHLLKSLGKNPEVILQNKPSRYQEKFLESVPDKKVMSDEKDLDYLRDLLNLKANETFLAVDTSTPNRLGSLEKAFDSAENKIVLDHHHPADWDRDVAYFGDSNAPATTQLVAQLSKKMTGKSAVNKDMSDALYAGLYTDTAGFRYLKDPNTFRLAAELVEAGTNPEEVYNKLYNNLRLKQLKRNAQDILSVQQDGDVVYGFKGKYKSPLTKNLLKLEDADFVWTASEIAKNKHQVELRSRRKREGLARAIAEELGGGGHDNAAGATIKGSREDVKSKIMGILKRNRNV